MTSPELGMTDAVHDAGGTRRSRWLDWPWHPTLFAITIVVAYWLDTVVSPYAAWRAVAVAVVIGVVMTAMCAAVTRSKAVGGVLATAILVALYSKHVVDIGVALARSAPAAVFAVWLVVLLLAVALAVRLAFRRLRRVTVQGLTRFLNAAAFVYLATSVVLGITSGKVAHLAADLAPGSSRVAADGAEASRTRPDIYVILLDGYPRSDVLLDAFGYDNSGFIEGLKERGFDVATDSRSTYLWTQQSLTSMLHMDYVEDIPDFMAVVDGRAARQPTLRDIVNDNPTFDLARDAGYRVVATGYEFEELALRSADVYLDPGNLNEFELQLLVSTFAGDIVGFVAPDFASSQHRAWIDFQLRAPGMIAGERDPAPRLVIGHIPAPHQPTVFRADGEGIPVPLNAEFYADSPFERGEPVDEFKTLYTAQLEYLDRRFLEMVDDILANSTEPPVIILWADHGSASRIDWTVTPPSEADSAALDERTSTLFAALTPGTTNVFPDDIEPFDIFRRLADSYLGTHLGSAVLDSGVTHE
jgi:hypothetical protein